MTYVPSTTGAAGGDLTGTYPNPTLLKIQGVSVAAAAPYDGYVLTYVVGTTNWQPLPPTSGSPTGTAGGDLSGTYPSPTVAKLQGYNVAAGNPTTTGYVLTWSGSQWAAAAPSMGSAGGDLSGTYPNPTVAKLQGYNVAAGNPTTTGYVLTWNGSQWAAAASTGGSPSGSAGGDLGNTYPNPIVTKLRGYPINASAPTHGKILVWDQTVTQSWVPTGVSGDLTGDWFGLTVAKIQGKLVSTIAPTNGQALVWNTVDGYYLPTTITAIGSAGGDLSGTYPNPTVAKLQGYNVSSSNPTTDGYVLTWNLAGTQWEARTVPAASSKVKARSSDTTEDYLYSKLSAGSNITISILNSGANEQVQISSSGGSSGTTIIASPTSLSGNTNDYTADSNISSANVLRLSSTLAVNITGFDAATAPTIVLKKFYNVGSFAITLTNNDSNSLAGNRMLIPGGTNLTLQTNDVVDIFYDITSLAWRVG